MKKLVLSNQWWYSKETIELDVRQPLSVGDFVPTTEVYHEDGSTYAYRARCEHFEWKDDVLKIRLRYDSKDSPHLPADEELWGTSKIQVNLKTGKAHAYWKSDFPKSSGRAKPCSIVNWGEIVLMEPAYRQFRGIYRPEQQKVRRDVIAIYGEVCAISKETTAAALELSHVVDVSRGGPYDTRNCFLLRADLHRLFDNHLLRIDADTGNVTLESAVSARYREEFEGMRLDEAVRGRLYEALAMRNKLREE